MKLCPLFESIHTMPDVDSNTAAAFECGKMAGINACNAALPRAAIEEAIDALEYRTLLLCVGYPKEQEIIEAIEQLKALLPKGPL